MQNSLNVTFNFLLLLGKTLRIFEEMYGWMVNKATHAPNHTHPCHGRFCVVKRRDRENDLTYILSGTDSLDR